MGCYLEPVDLDREFRYLNVKPTVLNDVEAFSSEDLERLNKLIMTTYSGDLLSNIPTCECGATTGEYNLGTAERPVICHVCKTPVQAVLDQDLQPLTWVRSPNGVRRLMNPLFWTMLKNHFLVSNFSLLNWLCDTAYHTNSNPPAELPVIEQFIINGTKIQRGYNYFVDNFREIINALLTLKRYKSKRDKSAQLLQMLDMYPNCVFTEYLPIPHRSLLVVEVNNTGTYMDPISTGAVDAIRTLAGIDTEHHMFTLRTRENRAVKAIDQLSEFYERTYSDTYAAKEGIFRKHVFATRSHWSFRAVVSSITERHNYDEIYIPWGIATSVFRTHLQKKLEARGYTPNEAALFINAHAQVYNVELDGLLDEILKESPNGRGPACTLGRNPSLHRSSIQLVYITQVKKDPDIPTVSMSILIVVGLNADFDGDALNFTLCIDQDMEQGLAMLAPHLSAFSLKQPRVISENLSMPKPAVATIANWEEYPLDPPDPVKLALMQEFV